MGNPSTSKLDGDSGTAANYVPHPAEAERLREALFSAIVDFRGSRNNRYAPKNFEKYCKALIEYEAKVQRVVSAPPTAALSAFPPPTGRNASTHFADWPAHLRA